MSNQEQQLVGAALEATTTAEAALGALPVATPAEVKVPWFVRLGLWLVQKAKNLVSGYYLQFGLFGFNLRIGKWADGDWGFVLMTPKGGVYKCTTKSVMGLWDDLKAAWEHMDAQA